MKFQKMLQLARMLPQRPAEVWDRIATVVEVKTEKYNVQIGDYNPITWDDLLRELDRVVDSRCSTIAEEPELAEIEKQVRERQQSLSDEAPFARRHDGDVLLGRMCYILTRATTPNTVVETGVAYGVTSAFVLKALSVNRAGQLHSVDLPPLGANADKYVGTLIPRELKERWRLHRGPSKRVLPPLLNNLESVDIFVHDSLHTYRTMLWEFETVQPFLKSGAIVVADDVQGNRAFANWSKIRPHRLNATLREDSKDSLLGISAG